MIDLVPWEVMTKISEVKLGALNYHNELIFFFFFWWTQPKTCGLQFVIRFFSKVTFLFFMHWFKNSGNEFGKNVLKFASPSY